MNKKEEEEKEEELEGEKTIRRLGKREKGSVRNRGMRHRVRGDREEILEKRI